MATQLSDGAFYGGLGAKTMLARAQQDAVWNRQQVANQLRSLLHEYYPAFVEAFKDRRPGGLAHPDACAVLAVAPTPTQAARLTRPQLSAALRRAGRQRGIAAASGRLQAIFRRTSLRQLPMVEQAMGCQALALLKQLEAAARAADDLAEATRVLFQQHPQMAIFTSFPGLGELPAARLQAEIGDDATRFADARGLKAYAGAAPATRASGKKLVVLHRKVKNQRLAAVGYLWTFAALRLSTGARAHYDRRRAAAQRTRRAILDAATRLFIERGYVATTIADVATVAGVALDTIYAVVGRKPTLFRLLIETAISGAETPISADERDYVASIRAEPEAGRKLELYARALRAIHGRLAPLLRVLQVAAPADPELAAVWSEIAERRARNMRVLVADLDGTGSLRQDVSREEAADVIWATNSPEFYVFLVHERGWDADHYAHWLADAWRRLLLRDT